MKTPATPINEAERLRTLYSLEILDTAAEERFDRLTRLARRMFNVSIALITLIDQDRQWFKSSIGIDTAETHRDISFCGHAILEDEILNIPDASKDDRFADNPLVTATPNIRFYAGCPLRALNGQKMGTLCLIDNQPRELSEEDLNALKDLEIMAERELAATQLATLDDLTMISNRHGFMLLADQEVKINRPQKVNSCFLVVPGE